MNVTEPAKPRQRRTYLWLPALLSLIFVSGSWAAFSYGQAPPQKPIATCAELPAHDKLRDALMAIVGQGQRVNTGLGNHEWAVVVDRDGLVCAVVFSGPDRAAEWPGSRLIAAQKANTANALSTPDFALSTANLYAATQPGQSLYGLVTTAPPNGQVAYSGEAPAFGQPQDPLVGKAIGGIVVFGGGLPLYASDGRLVGGLGVSGDTACADHVIAWKLRHSLALDAVPGGVAQGSNDNMILDFQNGASAGGFGHPSCKGGAPSDSAIGALPGDFPPSKKK